MHITLKRARICITYVHVHGRLGDMSIYMLGKVTYLGTGLLPAEPNRIRTCIKQESFTRHVEN